MAETKWLGRFIAVEMEGSWEYVRRVRGSGAAIVLARTEDDCVLLVEQYRVPLGCRTIELPAGIVGDDDDAEGAADTALRELEEETGYRAGKLRPLGDYVTTPGLSSERFTLFEATELERTGRGGGVDDEDIAVHHVPMAELQRFLAAKRASGLAIDKILAFLRIF